MSSESPEMGIPLYCSKTVGRSSKCEEQGAEFGADSRQNEQRFVLVYFDKKNHDKFRLLVVDR